MANYLNPSRYYLDDKDIADLVAGGDVSNRFLLSLLRRRGIFLPEPSKNWPREELVKLFARQLFTWAEVNEINKETSSADREEKVEICKLTGVPAGLDIHAVLTELQTNRASSKNEAYVLSKKADGTTAVSVIYTELDPFLARPFQKRERALDIEIQTSGSELTIRYSSNQRASQIVEVLAGIIFEKDPTAIEATRIEFPGLKEPMLRTEFFSQLMEKVSGFKILDVQDVKVDNRLQDETSKGSEDNDDEEIDNETDEDVSANQVQVVKGLIKKAVFTGVSVLTSDIYQQLRESGYFISSINWKALEISADHEVELRAEMADPIRFSDFRFDVSKITPLAADSEAFKKSLYDVKRSYIKRMQEAAFAAKKVVETKLQQSQKINGSAT
jgi:hypothetical protein